MKICCCNSYNRKEFILNNNKNNSNNNNYIIDTNYYKTEFLKTRDLWLEKVSRTFTMSIRILPPNLRNYVGHSYIICRFLDTIEDAKNLTVSKKHEALDLAIKSIRNYKNIDEAAHSESYFTELSKTIQSDKEWDIVLLKNSKKIFESLFTFPENIIEIIQTWTIEMAEGMKKYAFGEDKPEVSLKNKDEFEEYTYYVAGTVGKLLSDLYTQKNYYMSEKTEKILKENDIQFGKALQYVNILKDSREDIEEERCFIPLSLLEKYDITTETMFKKENLASLEKVYGELIIDAKKYLKNATLYIKTIPLWNWRIRLFCIWPVSLAYKTLNYVEKNIYRLTEDDKSLKISKKDAKRTIFYSSLGIFSNYYLKKYLERIEKDK